MYLLKSPIAVLVSSMIAITATTTSAQELEEIVVTAQKREQSLNDVSISISALSEDKLNKIGFDDPSDLALYVPGFSFAESGLNTPIYTLRGVGFSETSLAVSSTISVYVDEVPLPFPSTTKGAAIDLQRVEVVKGPQGTLYGQNTTGGAINYISNKPTEEFESGIEVGIGNFNTVDVGGYVSGPLSDNVRARLAVKTQNADGWQRSATRGEENGEIEKQAARLTIDVDASESLALSFSLNGWNDEGETQAPQLLELDIENPNNPNPALSLAPLGDGNPQTADFDEGVSLGKDDNFFQLSTRADWTINNNLRFTSISAYSEFETDATNEFDGTAVDVFGFDTGGEIDTISQEFRFTGTTRGVNWVAGVNYSDSDALDTNELIAVQTSSNINPPAGSGVLSAENFAEQDITTFGVFASADWTLSDQFKLTTGIRYTDFEADFRGCAGDTGDGTLSSVIQGASNFFRGNAGLAPLPESAFTPGVFATGTCTTFLDSSEDPSLFFTPGEIVDTLEEDNVSWRIALDYTPTDNTLVYASINRGFKSGSFPTIPSTSFEQYIPAVQEELLAYEVGFKSTLLKQTLQLNAALFFYDYQDKQLRGFFLDPIFATLSRLVNVPESEVTGFEFDLTWLPFDGLTVAASASFLDTEILDFQGINFSGDDTDFSGGVLSFAPETQVNLDAEYQWNVSTNLTAFVGSNFSYRDEASATFGEDPRLNIDSYEVLNLRAGITAEKWQVTVYGDNVTDEFFLNNIVPQFDTIKGFAGRTATYGVRFKYDF